jgi:hypothetical protein
MVTALAACNPALEEKLNDDKNNGTPDVVDTTAPVITLIGDATQTITVGTNYSDLGVAVSDDTDTDIEAVVTGTVDKKHHRFLHHYLYRH